jgi:hypothetical protein
MKPGYFIFPILSVISFPIILNPEKPYPWNVSALKETEKHSFFFIPGGGYFGRHSPNTFTKCYCGYMEELLGDDFTIIEKPVSKSSFVNVVWALSNGQRPLRKPEKNKKVIVAFSSIMEGLNDETTDINNISSSFGTVLTAQVGIYLSEYFSLNGGQHPAINLAMGASMISKESKLFMKLEELRDKGFITYIIYDELQDPGDSVTGMCGKSKIGAYLRGLRMSIVVFGKYMGQPSILNNNPKTGHIHLQRAQS